MIEQASFETALQRLSRILSRQYDLHLRYEGNKAHTDGKEIVLPYIEEISPELEATLNGLLDHTTAQCKFTNFSVSDSITGQLHDIFHTLVESVRVETKMVDEYPGCERNLDHINNKTRASVDKGWTKLPWPVRLVLKARDSMLGLNPEPDPDFTSQWEVIKPHLPRLKDCHSTKEVKDLTEQLVKLIIEDRAKEQKQQPQKGKGPTGPDGQPKTKGDPMLTASKESNTGEGKEVEGQAVDAMSIANAELAEGIEHEVKIKYGNRTNVPHIPLSTKYDHVTDLTKVPNIAAYNILKSRVMPQVRSIMAALERALKIREDAKFNTELPRGRINTKALARFVTDDDYRTPFKKYIKSDVTNCAVEMLIDCSGSMSGSQLTLAKMAACALGEALYGLDIPFEVTGFTAGVDVGGGQGSLRTMANKIAHDEGHQALERFNRTHEILVHYIFKSFSCTSLAGLGANVQCGNNIDNESIQWAAQRLIQRGERRKILVVLSDGQPAHAGDNTITYYDLVRQVKKLEKAGIEIVGIGIMTNAVERFYSQSVVVNDASELAQVVMTTFSKILLKGIDKYR